MILSKDGIRLAFVREIDLGEVLLATLAGFPRSIKITAFNTLSRSAVFADRDVLIKERGEAGPDLNLDEGAMDRRLCVLMTAFPMQCAARNRERREQYNRGATAGRYRVSNRAFLKQRAWLMRCRYCENCCIT